MVSVEARAVETDGITLVVGTLAGGPVPTRVTVENCLDGPVWPPRRMGRPEAGWDASGFTGVIPAEECVPIGYACPAPAADPPLELVATERADGADGDLDTPGAVLRGLGSPAPPREAVSLPVASGGAANGGDGQQPTGWSGVPDDVEGTGPPRAAGDRAADRALEFAGDAEPSDPVAAWLGRVERRLDRVERLATAEDVPAATAALREVGSLEAARTLEGQRRTDADRLREVTRRANALAYRAERAAIPIDALVRLA